MNKSFSWRGTCVAFLVCSAPITSGDDATTIPAAETVPAPHYTTSLRVKAPSVQVRSNPKAANDNTQGAGQYAFIDENGELTSTPPADFEFPETEAARAADPVPRRSAVDPNAMVIDTSHIRAVMRVRIDEGGKPTVECLHSTDPALQKSCTQPHDATTTLSEPTAKEGGR